MVNRTVGSDVSRFYDDHVIWEAATDNDLPAAGAGQEGEGFDDSNFTNGFITLAGGVQDVTDFRELYASAGEEFNPIDGTGCFHISTGSSAQRMINLQDDFFLLRNWGFENNTATDGLLRRVLDVNTAASNCTFVACMFKKQNGTATSSDSACVGVFSSGHEFYSCIAIGSSGASNAGAVSGFFTAEDTEFYNCVTFGIDNGTTGGTCNGFNINNASAVVVNCAAFDSEDNDFLFTSIGTNSNNASSDTTGDTGLISLTATNEFTAPGSDDFTLLVGGTLTLEDAGTNSPGNRDDSFVVGDNHVATFEVGAYNFTAAAGRRRMVMVT